MTTVSDGAFTGAANVWPKKVPPAEPAAIASLILLTAACPLI